MKDNRIHYRRYAREWVMQFLFQYELISPEDNINPVDHFTAQLRESDLFELPDKKLFKRSCKDALKLLAGIINNQIKIDEVLSRFASKSNWTLKRMDIVDRNIMRISIYEMLYCHNIPPIVSIDEAVEIGKKYGSSNSTAFINGILHSIKNTLNNNLDQQETLNENAN